MSNLANKQQILKNKIAGRGNSKSKSPEERVSMNICRTLEEGRETCSGVLVGKILKVVLG